MMMDRSISAISLASCLALICACGDAGDSRTQCGSDRDCKGERVCKAGVCVDPESTESARNSAVTDGSASRQAAGRDGAGVGGGGGGGEQATSCEPCPASMPVCDPERGVCVECLEAADCAEPRPVCNPMTATCTDRFAGTWEYVSGTRTFTCPGSEPTVETPSGSLVVEPVEPVGSGKVLIDRSLVADSFDCLILFDVNGDLATAAPRSCSERLPLFDLTRFMDFKQWTLQSTDGSMMTLSETDTIRLSDDPEICENHVEGVLRRKWDSTKMASMAAGSGGAPAAVPPVAGGPAGPPVAGGGGPPIAGGPAAGGPPGTGGSGTGGTMGPPSTSPFDAFVAQNPDCEQPGLYFMVGGEPHRYQVTASLNADGNISMVSPNGMPDLIMFNIPPTAGTFQCSSDPAPSFITGISSELFIGGAGRTLGGACNVSAGSTSGPVWGTFEATLQSLSTTDGGVASVSLTEGCFHVLRSW